MPLYGTRTSCLDCTSKPPPRRAAARKRGRRQNSRHAACPALGWSAFQAARMRSKPRQALGIARIAATEKSASARNQAATLACTVPRRAVRRHRI